MKFLWANEHCKFYANYSFAPNTYMQSHIFTKLYSMVEEHVKISLIPILLQMVKGGRYSNRLKMPTLKRPQVMPRLSKSHGTCLHMCFDSWGTHLLRWLVSSALRFSAILSSLETYLHKRCVTQPTWQPQNGNPFSQSVIRMTSVPLLPTPPLI